MSLRRVRHTAPVLAGAVVAVLLLGSLGGAVGAADGSADRNLASVTLRVGVVSPSNPASQDIRLASKAFENAPYAISWASFPTSTGALEALNAGALDLAVDIQSTAPLFAQANAKTPWTKKTAPFKLISASLPPPETGIVIYTRTGSGIKSVKDLVGKKVAYAKGSVAQYFWVVTAKDNKLKPGSVQEVQLATGEARPALLSGAVDAMVTVKRTLLGDVAAGKVQVLPDADLKVPEYKVTVARSDSLADRDTAKAIGEFQTRLARSKRWLAKHQEEAAQIYATSARLSATDGAAAAAELPRQLLPVDHAVVAELQKQNKVFFDVGVITSDPKVSIIVDRRYDRDITG